MGSMIMSELSQIYISGKMRRSFNSWNGTVISVVEKMKSFL